MMTYTATTTQTSTMTEARVRAVMNKVSANLAAFLVSGFITGAQIAKWVDDLIYLQLQEALDFFELQATKPGGTKVGIRYKVNSDGSSQQDSSSGGIDVYGLPAGTTIGLFARLKEPIPTHIREELSKRGWGFNGQQLNAAESEQRMYSSGGYGLTRTKVGLWP